MFAATSLITSNMATISWSCDGDISIYSKKRKPDDMKSEGREGVEEEGGDSVQGVQHQTVLPNLVTININNNINVQAICQTW